MPKYLVRARYSAEGVKGLLREGGTSRRAAVAGIFEAAGGRMESFYWALGKDDAYIIAELPDNATAAAISLTVSASGAVVLRTVALLDAEEIDGAAKMSVQYRPPGAQ
jgi:uncharacterized protein with GYD domain